MKITKKQRELVIKDAIKRIKNTENVGICWAIHSSLLATLGICLCPVDTKGIQKYIPKFKYSTARKYFGAEGNVYWWRLNERGNEGRIQFLNYLLTGKLPKVKK